MKTEVFVGTHHLKEGLLSPPKSISEHLASVLLLDTPQNTPVGSPESDSVGSLPSDSVGSPQSDSVGSPSSDPVENPPSDPVASPQPGIVTESNDPIPSTSAGPSRANVPLPSPPVPIPKKKKKGKKKRPEYLNDQVFTDLFEMSYEVLGSGAFGMVKSCTEVKTRKEYAVKIISKDKPGHTRRRAFRELETFHTCRRHKNIVHLVNFFEEHDRFLMVFEKVPGGPLLHHIEKLGSFTEREASMVIRDLADALMFMHSKGIAHRDLKPDNILCESKLVPFPVKICDFDLATAVVYNKHATSTPLSSPELTSPVGSPEYMAPEVVLRFVGKAKAYDKKCDLWSLGVVMYMLLCGYPPFYGNCGASCGWENGQSCNACRDNLFDMIQMGIYSFPDKEWKDISYTAKELIGHLLVTDASQRYSAETVLNHPWVANGNPNKYLGTPTIIRRNNSATSLSAFAKDANAYQRAERPQGDTTDTSSLSSSFKESSFSSSFEVSPHDPAFYTRPGTIMPGISTLSLTDSDTSKMEE